MKDFIPAQIKKRTDKIGFATPEYDWLKTIKPYIFRDNNSMINEILNISLMEKDWENILARQNKVGITNVWRYIDFILWFKIFKVTL